MNVIANVIKSTTLRVAAVSASAIFAVACVSAPATDRGASPEACALLAEVDATLDKGGAPGPDGRVAPRTVSSNRITTNRIISNRIISNRVVSNRVVSNRITSNRITTNGVASSDGSLEELVASEGGRELLRYAVRCAFLPGQTLVVPGDGGLVFEGSLGIAPAWEERALTAGEERWISACLLAHANAFGVSVPLSVRATNVIEADAVEREAFPVHEGAFFGSAATGAFYSCHAEAPERARTQSADRGLRVCTDEDDACAIQSVGPCADVCEHYEAGIGFSGCRAAGVRYVEVVNAHLRSNAILATCGLPGAR